MKIFPDIKKAIRDYTESCLNHRKYLNIIPTLSYSCKGKNDFICTICSFNTRDYTGLNELTELELEIIKEEHQSPCKGCVGECTRCEVFWLLYEYVLELYEYVLDNERND